MAIPEGWTDDLNIPLPPGRSAEEVAEFVIQSFLEGNTVAAIEAMLVGEFLLSTDDAAVARDRTFGGIVRAATRNSENCPRREKDPIAWESYHRAKKDPTIIARIFPQYALDR